MRVRHVLFACAIVGSLLIPAEVLAQYQSNNNNMGSSSGGMSSGGASQGRQGMFGNRTMGGAGTRSGRGTFNAGNAFGASNDLSNARFVRGNRQAGDFVGTDAQDQQHEVGGVQDDMNTGNYPQSGGPTSSTSRGSNNPNSRQNTNRNRQDSGGSAGQNSTSIRTTFRAGFDYPKPKPNQLKTTLTRRLALMSSIQTQAPIRVEVQGRTTILRGVVATDHDRFLAESMIRLEPGVEKVKNELEVENPTPEDSTPP
jgi:osmotically-inducible protein OsmY